MAGFGSRSFISVKDSFFDRPGLTKVMDKAKLSFLARSGALVRRTAQFLIRPGKKISKPGSPPNSHTKALRRNIFFGIDKSLSNPDCLVGPIALNSKRIGKDGKPVKGTVPNVLETSGDIWLLEVFQYGKWRPANLKAERKITGLPVRYRKVHVAARPFMGPALAACKPKFAGLMRGTFKKG